MRRRAAVVTAFLVLALLGVAFSPGHADVEVLRVKRDKDVGGGRTRVYVAGGDGRQNADNWAMWHVLFHTGDLNHLLVRVYTKDEVDGELKKTADNLAGLEKKLSATKDDVLATIKSLGEQKALQKHLLRVLKKEVLADKELRDEFLTLLKKELREDKHFREMLAKDLAAELKNKGTN